MVSIVSISRSLILSSNLFFNNQKLHSSFMSILCNRLGIDPNNCENILSLISNRYIKLDIS